MHFKKCIFLFSFISLTITNCYATTYYRHIPFTVSLTSNDKLIVDYNFTEKKGIRCIANHDRFKMDFIYKGHQKSAYLPVILESDHIPTADDHNELADVAGQFELYLQQQSINNKQFSVNCTYA